MELQNSTVPPTRQEQSTVPVGLKCSARVADRLPHDTVSFRGLPVKPQQDNSLLARDIRAAQGVWDSIRDSSLPDPNQMDQFGNTALHQLLKQANPDPAMVERLLKKGADPNIPNNDKNNALHLFVEQKNPNPQILDCLLPFIKDINQRGLYEQTALHKLFNVVDPNPLMIKRLLEKGADPNIRDFYIDNVLHLFVQKTQNPNPEILQALIQSGMDLNQKDGHEKPALFYLLKDRPNIQTIRMLLGNGARLNERYGLLGLLKRTPLHWVMEQPNPDPALIRLFLEKGADAHMKDGCGNTALQHYKEKFPGQSSPGAQLLEEHMERVRQHTPSLRIEEIHDAPAARTLQEAGCAVRPAEGAALKTTSRVLKQGGKNGVKTVWQSLMENLKNFWKQLLGLLLCR